MNEKRELAWKLEGDLFDLIKEEVMAYWLIIQEKYSDGQITLAEIFDLVAKAIEAFVRIAEVLDVPNPEKRELLLEVMDATYEQVIAPLDIPWIPNVFEPIFDRVMGEIVHLLAERLLEALLPDEMSDVAAGEDLSNAASKAISDAEKKYNKLREEQADRNTEGLAETERRFGMKED
jgi:hypothetical protein